MGGGLYQSKDYATMMGLLSAPGAKHEINDMNITLRLTLCDGEVWMIQTIFLTLATKILQQPEIENSVSFFSKCSYCVYK